MTDDRSIVRIPKSKRIPDLEGKRFGSWTVVSYYGRKIYSKSKTYAHYWAVRCKCGEGAVIEQRSFTTGQSAQCKRCSHGEPEGWTHPLYSTWTGMKSRCSNPNHADFEYYGARGVQVCPQWQKSFWAFLADVGEKPSPELTLDRIDTNGDYEPGNVRWADYETQMKNRRPWSKTKPIVECA